ncbi:MAG TPA: YebC/PmpR family DNA-binding transcriptional regulator [Candidatus Cloacimonetes bacterium]|nr:YebC/PmpR family DNA-binding transcriptional regulator [Candidatus Cloacimonadota bacterium]HEX37410.1 YebC/PmpR family DNA-binding transcriptional regulator [Candidatus Cloacimonadota bacterium]
MSGHNKWSSIKHKKAKEDAKRGKVFTKIIREIIIAARDAGGDIETNPALRNAVNKANAENMPKDNIERAIKKGTGELEGVNYESVIYEGYAPGGVAMIIQAVTDNKQRTVAEVRHVLTKHNGSLAEKGSVSWNFTQAGMIMVPKEGNDEDELMMTALDLGADDFSEQDDFFIITTNAKELYNVVNGLEKQGIKIENADLEYLPQNTVPANDTAAQVIKIIEALEELDDVQNVYANFQIDDEILEKVAGE